jgi:hypothetical protein
MWSRQYAWVARASIHDREIERRHREQAVLTELEVRERHGRLAQATLTVLSAPVLALLQAFRDPEAMERLVSRARAGDVSQFLIVARVAQVMPKMMMMERLALGITDTIEVPQLSSSDSVAARIASDPEATSLAIALLNCVASR